MRATHTYAILEVSRAAHDEIRKLLEEAGYDHAFVDELIDMHGIAIKAREGEPRERDELMAYIDDAKRAAGGERVSGEPLAEFIARILEELQEFRGRA